MFKTRAMFSEERHHLENIGERHYHHSHHLASCAVFTDNCVFPPLEAASGGGCDIAGFGAGTINSVPTSIASELLSTPTPDSFPVASLFDCDEDLGSTCGSESENSEESVTIPGHGSTKSISNGKQDMRSHPDQENLVNQRRYRKKRGLYHQVQQRQAANLRERRRMQSINDAFEVSQNARQACGAEAFRGQT